MFIRNGKKVRLDSPITVDAVTYPNLCDPAIRVLLGVTEVPDPVMPDGRFYYASENADGSLTVTPKPLDQVVPVRWEQVKQIRDERRFNGGVKVGAYWFKSDQQATGEYTALAMLGAGLPGTTVLRPAWRTMAEGVVTDMTPDLVKQILMAGFAAVAAIDDAAQAHHAALIACTTVEELAAYDVTTGWPVRYESA